MENRVYLQPAYILHKQPYQNSSLLVDFFCLDYGRVRAVARGARRPKSRHRALLQEFQPLLVSFTGKGEVKTVASVEAGAAPCNLSGERLFSGLYLNELITRLLMSHVEHAELYLHYEATLAGLRGEQDLNRVLRSFELGLLDELGYGLNLDQDCVTREAILPGEYYLFVPEHGFERLSGPSGTETGVGNVFLGSHIIDLHKLDFGGSDSAIAGKKIIRLALQVHLNGRPLHSRNLFARQARGSRNFQTGVKPG